MTFSATQGKLTVQRKSCNEIKWVNKWLKKKRKKKPFQKYFPDVMTSLPVILLCFALIKAYSRNACNK
jgi:hypothetical protein